MIPVDPPRLDGFEVDVRALLERSVASFYAHLVTRPTGRAVRMAIEGQLGDLRGPVLSLLDLSSVAILDYSCADEVVAKLLLRYGGQEGEDAFFVLKGIREHHREPIEAVLERHELWIVGETGPRHYELLGPQSRDRRRVWNEVEERRRVQAAQFEDIAPDPDTRLSLDHLIRKRLVFKEPGSGDLYALSALSDISCPGH